MRRLSLLLLVGTATACSGVKKDWDQDVILQLFKPAAEDVGQVEVQVTELIKDGHERKAVVSLSFADCDSNQVRIISRQVNGSYPDLGIVVRYGPSSKREARELTKVSPASASGPVKLVLSSRVLRQQDLAPSACAPQTSGPTTDAGATDGTSLRPLGEACTEPGQCAGGQCLVKTTLYGTEVPFPGGYCSALCLATQKAGDVCSEGGGVCVSYDKLYCLKKCTTVLSCRAAEGYRCEGDPKHCQPGS